MPAIRKISIDEATVRLVAILHKPIARHSVSRAAIAAGVSDGKTMNEPIVQQMANTYRASFGRNWFPPMSETKPAA